MRIRGIDQANEILGLMIRHWNDIAGTLRDGAARKRLGDAITAAPPEEQKGNRPFTSFLP